MTHHTRSIAPAILLAVAGSALAQNAASVDFAGASISSISSTPPDLVRTSTTTISPAAGYLFAFDPIVRGTGFIGAIFIPSDTPLGDVLNTFYPGGRRTLYGAVRNPGGLTPVQINREVLAGTFSGLSVSLTFDQRVLANNRAEAAIRNIQKPIGFGLSFVSGGATYQTFSPPPPTRSEWHFQNSLLSVREDAAEPSSGPAKLRFLDDPAFGPILGGPGEETQYPNPPTPHNVTASQAAFNSASAFGLPPINGEDDIVLRTSPPRNLADPANRAKSRGLGLALFPNSRDAWPDDRLGQWTLVWDLLIPQSSWNAGGLIVPLLEDNHNNDNQADLILSVTSGVASIEYRSTPLQLPALQPNQWTRLVVASDGYRAKSARVYLNGSLAGIIAGDWVYASTASNAPAYGDRSSTNPLGTPVNPADWNAWGQFPSPWALSPNNDRAPMASTLCLFSDLQGRGQPIYLANLAFTDEALPDADAAALGGPSARGIFYPRPTVPPACPPDFNDDGFLDFFDLDAYVACFEGLECPQGKDADYNTDGFVDFFDLDAFTADFEAGC
ncbi:MAG: hypothetical protein HRU70_08410 [Phycisphaeraceae bacterium]|nr:MAG: hypothetical protein HRU70_08410 [Phycisphaeraceae bacterium]